MGKRVIEVPSDLSQVSLNDYLRFVQFDSNDEEAITYKAFECFLNLDKDHVRVMNYTDAQLLYNDILKIFERKPKAERLYNVGGVTFGRIPNLNEISFGEFVDLDNYLKVDKESKPNFDKALNFMGVLYRPVKDRYNQHYSIEEYESSTKYQDKIKQLPASAYLGSIVFFCDLRSELLSDMNRYLVEAEVLVRNAKGSGLNTAGMEASINSQREILERLIELQPIQYTKLLPSLPTKLNKPK